MNRAEHKWVLPLGLTWFIFLAVWAAATGFFVNEYITWRVVQLPLGELVQDRLVAGHMPGYFILLKGWVAVFPDTEFGMRLPSMLCMAVALVAFHGAMRIWAGASAAALATLLFAFHQLTAWTVMTARPYGMMLAALMVAWWSLARWWESEQRGWLVLMFLSLSIGAAAQVLTALHTAGIALWMAVLLVRRREKDRAWPPLLVSLLSLLVLLLPTLVLTKEQENFDEGFTIGLPLGRGLTSASKVWFGDWDLWYDGPNSLAKYGILALIVTVIYFAFRWLRDRPAQSSESPRFPLGGFLACWLVVPWVGLMLMQNVGGQAVLSQLRYFSGFVPAMATLTAMALLWLALRSAGKPAWLRVMPAVPVCGLYLFAVAGWLRANGDGPKLLQQELDQSNVRVLVTNDEEVFVFEARKAGTHQVIKLEDKDPDQIKTDLVRIASQHGSYWLVIYDNHPDPHDPFMEQPPTPLTTQGDVVEYLDARAVLIEGER